MKIIYKIILIVFIASLFVSCNNKSTNCSDNPNYIKKEKSLCKANDINDLIVFIKVKPANDYEYLGTIKNDFFNQVNDATKEKGFGKVVKGLFEATNNNVDLQKLLEGMTNKAKLKYPKAEAVIFKDNLSNCEVIKFKGYVLR